MATDEFGEKTEQPTDHRRREARRKGNVARSRDLNAAVLLLAATLGLSFFGMDVLQSLGRLIEVSLKSASPAGVTSTSAVERLRNLFEYSLVLIAPFLLLMLAAAVLVNIMQVGVLVTPGAVTPKFSRLNPVEGFKRLVSVRALVRLAGSLAKFTALIAVAALFIATSLPALLSLSGTSLPLTLQTIHSSVVGLGYQLALALIALALLDFVFQKWKHEQDLRMSKQEVREEMKQMEGDPVIRQQRKEAHRKLVEARELNQVRDADVVVWNPTNTSVALKYDPETMPAPTVVARGMGELAERIQRIAIENGVPVIERKEVARALYKNVRVGDSVPPEMYKLFVEIMAYVYQITGRTVEGLR